ncbi:SIMPL domain-containing protein [Acetobacter sp.]|uniref:SIMPL domain-containing protein n=1 Tax=Acetobacter sp. TaxID=440 RepID=UPI0039ED08B8
MISRKLLKPFTAATTILCLGGMLVHPAQAADDTSHPNDTKLNIGGTASVQAAPDEATATLLAQNEGSNAVDAQRKTNGLAQSAIALAEKATGVVVHSESYSVYENRPDKQPHSWTAQQTLSLTAKDSSGLLELVGKLQEKGLLLQNVSWSLSPEHQKQLQKQAEQQAVRDMKERADAIAATLGMKVTSIASLSVNEQPLIRPMALMARAEIAPSPAMRPDSQTVTANVHATVILSH